MATIDILLATYNGARYLPELLESLERQTYKDWRLIVRDDGSTDASLSIIDEWAQRTCTTPLIIRDDRVGLGAAANFGALLEASDAPYFALCDQDDVWLPDKLSKFFARMRSEETCADTGEPLFTFSDLYVVDSMLKPIHPSFRTYMGRQSPRAGNMSKQLIIQNFAVGCASMGNAALRNAALPIPAEAMMHDWWLALVAATFGQLVDVPEATVLYRQHTSNAAGAQSWSLPAVALRVGRDPLASILRANSMIESTQRQARAFTDRYAERLEPDIAELMRNYGSLGERSFWARKRFVLTNALWTRSWIKNLSFMVSV